MGRKKDLTKKYAGHINFFTVKEFLSLTDNAGLALKQKRFSEHFLGQLLGVAAFRAMDARARHHPNEQINNEQFFKSQKSSGIFSAFKKSINFLITLESFLWSRVRSPNLHAIFKKI
jgi:2-iminoacetate synthase ThiH